MVCTQRKYQLYGAFPQFVDIACDGFRCQKFPPGWRAGAGHGMLEIPVVLPGALP
jgi:hypothetical protein